MLFAEKSQISHTRRVGVIGGLDDCVNVFICLFRIDLLVARTFYYTPSAVFGEGFGHARLRS